MTTIKITDRQKYNKEVDDIDTSGLAYRGTNGHNESLGFTGSISINDRTYTGDHGDYDYAEEYGSILTINY